jgi:hypothetical protein
MTERNNVRIMFVGHRFGSVRSMLFLQVMYANHADIIYWAGSNCFYVHTYALNLQSLMHKLS